MLTVDATPAEINLSYLEDAVRALAQSPEVQQQLLAENPMAGDEMAIDFDAWYVPAVRDGYLADWTPDQCQALKKIDLLLTQMTALQETELWTSDALATSSWWVIVRSAARDALRRLQWPPNPPERLQNKTIVVGESQE
ncbi:hypothetical protein K7W42_17735 [Deinococcus sp. HMF7604]|uniref:hypothetical protein n=1 Tax=Deinococcus betulae TaxID=2873312 RepID=UPI001CCA2455|nr:hypothetical protein [Deinococcus betulae]MBZ9752687.1 hypothetical protein [Deinococcus betulae]